MTDVQQSDWEQPDMPPPRPDPIRPGPRGIRSAEGVALRDYVEMKLAHVDEKGVMRVESLAKELAVALRMSEVAIDKADRATEKRFEGVNEFRQTLTDQASLFTNRETVDAIERNLLEKIDNLRQAHISDMASLRATMDSKFDAQYKILWTLAGAVAAIQATLAFLG